MKKSNAYVLGVIVVLVLLLGWRVVVVLRSGKAGPEGRGKRDGAAAVAVETEPIRRATIREIGRFTGSLQARSEFIVAPKISGRLEKLTVNVGDTVKSGQMIAQLDDDEYAQQVEQARAETAVAKAGVAECRTALEVASNEFTRVEALHGKKVASDSELDEAVARYSAGVAKYDVALAEVSRQEAAMKAAEVRLSYAAISVSWPATNAVRVVGERFVDEGEMLKPNSPIVSILDINIMTALIDVIERDYSKIKIGQQATIATDAFPGREFTGTIVRIAPMLKDMSRQARIEIEIPNGDGQLKPGMFVRASMEFDAHENATVVPVAALARREGRQGVFLVDAAEMKARFVPVTVGIVEGENAEITEPELSGVVATLGHHLLEDGAPVRLPGAEPAKAPEKARAPGGGR